MKNSFNFLVLTFILILVISNKSFALLVDAEESFFELYYAATPADLEKYYQQELFYLEKFNPMTKITFQWTQNGAVQGILDDSPMFTDVKPGQPADYYYDLLEFNPEDDWVVGAFTHYGWGPNSHSPDSYTDVMSKVYHNRYNGLGQKAKIDAALAACPDCVDFFVALSCTDLFKVFEVKFIRMASDKFETSQIFKMISMDCSASGDVEDHINHQDFPIGKINGNWVYPQYRGEVSAHMETALGRIQYCYSETGSAPCVDGAVGMMIRLYNPDRSGTPPKEEPEEEESPTPDPTSPPSDEGSTSGSDNKPAESVTLDEPDHGWNKGKKDSDSSGAAPANTTTPGETGVPFDGGIRDSEATAGCGLIKEYQPDKFLLLVILLLIPLLIVNRIIRVKK